MTIYIVWGDNGEDYEDHRDWAVCAYTTKEAAKQHAVAAEVRMREIVKDGNKKRMAALELTLTGSI